MRIAIMGAMREEIDPILETVGEYTTIEHAGNVFMNVRMAGMRLYWRIRRSEKFFQRLRHR